MAPEKDFDPVAIFGRKEARRMDRFTQFAVVATMEALENANLAVTEIHPQLNPLGGCLPMLLQLPIWFALYASLSTNIELFHAPFTLWWRDLSSPDPYYVLPVALGVLMFLQQKMTPSAAMDPVQAKMMLYLMPAMMMSFMLFLPAGLCIYILTNSALSIGQQRLIEHRLKVVSGVVWGAIIVNKNNIS
ncbi:MAG: membrane protein insertase YidC [Candidatus Odinarchaeota archaeon]